MGISEHLKRLDEKLTPFYKLENGKVVKCTLQEYMNFISESNLTIKRTTIKGILISTCFIGIGSFYVRNRPLVFETMIFGGIYNNSQWKNGTKEEALKQHEQACDLVKSSM